MIKWIIESMKVKPNSDNKTDVVSEVAWRVMSSENENTIELYGSISIPLDDKAFTPFQNLTESQVLSWVFNQINKTEIEEKLNNLMNEKKFPNVIDKSNPWEKKLPNN